MVTEIRRAESDRNSNNAAIFYGYPYFSFYLEEIFCTHLFPVFFFVIRYRNSCVLFNIKLYSNSNVKTCVHGRAYHTDS